MLKIFMIMITLTISSCYETRELDHRNSSQFGQRELDEDLSVADVELQLSSKITKAMRSTGKDTVDLSDRSDLEMVEEILMEMQLSEAELTTYEEFKKDETLVGMKLEPVASSEGEINIMALGMRRYWGFHCRSVGSARACVPKKKACCDEFEFPAKGNIRCATSCRSGKSQVVPVQP